MEARILRRRDVERLTLLSKASIYRLMQLGMFPTPLKLGQRAVAWRADEIHEWIASRPRATGDVPRCGLTH
ncbi:MAG: AlpA family phage regulatory protein [Bryobacterales bacterium]|nr:AlpA family phage regulatory protein [Bryobacterales bacterium]